MASVDGTDTSPDRKLGWAIAIGFLLALPLFFVWMLVYDRQTQSQAASESITEGWGDRQIISGPLLVVPYRAQATETVVENGQSVTRSRDVIRELTVAPTVSVLDTKIRPERRKRSIYEAVVYDARATGHASFVLPDLAQAGVEATALDLYRAELRFGISDPRGLGANPQVNVGGKALVLQPGEGSTGGKGFFSWIDASMVGSGALDVDYSFNLRGNGSIGLAPAAGQTDWTATSSWQNPSFTGDFLPSERRVDQSGFSAHYRIGNLALGKSLIRTALPGENRPDSKADENPDEVAARTSGRPQIGLIQPVNLYSHVDRSAKYGFLFIGFTFLALLMFDVIGGATISAVEYLLTGAALILFFVLLLALAEIIGFTPAYILAAAAITGLNTAYAAAFLKSWRRASFVGALLVGLYAVLYILISLEAFSLIIGSTLLFVALAAVMYATRHIDWGARSRA
ncbi:MAG: cell envelope integrity protein CreD [Pseudomonadota bacterium]